MPGLSRNPYRRIIERNLFRLKPAPVPTFAPLPASQPKVVLTGITTILGDKRALLKIQFPAQPPAKPREDTCILTEGQSDGPVRVLQINVKAASVTVDDAGTQTVVTFSKDNPAPATPASRAQLPGARPLRRFFRGGNP